MVRVRWAVASVVASLLVLLPADAGAAAKAERFVVVSSGHGIGSMEVVTDGDRVQVRYRIDWNGRGPKLDERIRLGPAAVPVSWEIEGKAWVGAPVRESFEVAGGKARWRSLDDGGETVAPAVPLYLPNNGSPWVYGQFARALQRARDATLPVLPGGTVRLERIRAVPPTVAGERLTVAALWGLDASPILILLDRRGRFAGYVEPGWMTCVTERLGPHAGALSRAVQEASEQVLASFSAARTHRPAGPVALTNVRVFDPARGTIGAPTTVVLAGDRIARIGADAPPADALVVDGEGGTLLPGLHDLHTHLVAWGGPLHLAAGVTTVRDVGNDNATLEALWRRVAAGEVLGPRIHRVGLIEGKSPFSLTGGFVVESEQEALEKVRWYADHGFEQIKLYNSSRPEWVRPVAAEAHRLGLRLSGHVPAFMTSERALRDGYDEVHHINQLVLPLLIAETDDTRTPFRFTALGERCGTLDLSGEPFQRLLRTLKDRRAAVDPTLAVFGGTLLGRPGKVTPNDAPWLDHMPVAVQRARRTATLDLKPEQEPLYEASWKRLLEVVALLDREGIRLLPGTDDMPGLMLHSELDAWVKAGLAPARVLRAATLDAAAYLGTDQDLGSVERGKRADLLLVPGDPTQDISVLRKVRLVVKDGVLYHPDEIHAGLGIRSFAHHPQETPPAR